MIAFATIRVRSVSSRARRASSLAFEAASLAVVAAPLASVATRVAFDAASVVAGSAEKIGPVRDAVGVIGGVLDPHAAWLLLRGLKTLALRMQRHNATALEVARWLESHAKVRRVWYPGLPSHPQHALAQRQMTGSSSLFGFTLATDDVGAVKRFFDGLALFGRGVSWGGHESLVYSPSISALKEQTPERFAAMGLRPGDMRVSVGLEHADDLIEDLAQALDRI